MSSMFRVGFRMTLAAVFAAVLLPGQVWAKDDLFSAVPAESMFCVRVNNLDGALGSLEQFVAGLDESQEPGEVKAGGSEAVAQMLGLTDCSNLNMKGSFALFGLSPAEGQVAIAILVPATSFEKFVGAMDGAGKADAKGIIAVGAEEAQPGVPATAERYVAQAGKFALVSVQANYDQFAAILSKVKAGSGLEAGLAPQDAAEAVKSPLWAYVNMPRTATILKPFVNMAMAAMQMQMAAAQGQGAAPAMPMAKIMDMYRVLIDRGMGEIESLTLTLAPSAERLTVGLSVAAVKGTALADMLASDPSAGKIGLTEYLDDDAMVTFAGGINKKLFKGINLWAFDAFTQGQQDAAMKENMAKLRDLTVRSCDAMGQSAAFSVRAGEGTPPFGVTYVIDIADAKAFEKVTEEEKALFETGVMSKMYEDMGMKMDFQMQRGVAKYRDVSIDAMKITMPKMGEAQADAAIKAMYGDALEMRQAVVGDKMVMAMSADSDAAIRKLIDAVKDRTRKQPPADVKAALAMVSPGPGGFVGTFNVVRAMKLGMKVAASVAPEAKDMPEIKAVSKSSVVFAGGTGNGRMSLEVIVPKAHLLEIKAAAESAEQQAVTMTPETK